MLDSLFNREDVKSLIKMITTSNRYNKNLVGSPVNMNFLDIKDSLIFVYESLYKYKIIVEDEVHLDDFVFKINRYLFRLDDYSNMVKGVNRLIGKYLYDKLGLEENNENKKIILNYVYYKYINNGYLFYGCNDRVVSNVLINGFDKSSFDNSSELINMFNEKEINLLKNVCLTDNFYNACFDGYSYPNHLSRIFNNHYTVDKGFDTSIFYKKDYLSSLSILNKICKSLEFNKKKRNIIINTFNDDWNKYFVNTCKSKVLLIKRSFLGMDSISNIEVMINELMDKDIEVGIARIIDYKYNSIEITGIIPSNDIFVISLLSNKNLYLDEVNSEVDLLEGVSLKNQYGNTTWLFVLVSILINLGILVIIILLGGY